MASPQDLVFTVRRQEPVLVAPAEPTPHEFKPLSDIDDQDGWRLHVRGIQVYQNNPSIQGKDPVSVIKEALSKVLVYYYPLAGRLREGPDRKLTVECTGEGVIFIEADADVRLEEISHALHPPFPCFDELLHDVKDSDGIVDCPLLLFQVTRFSCGGFILAHRLNHTLCDGMGMMQFLTALAEMARGQARLTVAPVWKRELMSARNPPEVSCIHREYDDVRSNKESTIPLEDMNNIIGRSYYFGPKEIAALRNHLPRELREKYSTFDVLTACYWKCRTVALKRDPDEEVRVLVAVNARGRYNPPLPTGYYGNAIATPAAITTAAKLCQNPLSYAVDLIKKAKSSVTDEYMRSLADLMVLRNRPQYTLLNSYIASDLTRTGFKKLDFGWGDALYSGPAIGALYVTFYNAVNNAKGEEGIVAPVYLPPAALKRFEAMMDAMLSAEPDHESLV